MDKLIKLKSGLRLAVSTNAQTEGLAIGIFVKTGSSKESSKQNGISHFIEHMLFKGTEKRTAYQIAEEMESMGVNINAFTSKEITAYYTVAVKDCAEHCMEMLSDMFFNSTFTAENLEKEKSVVLEEIKMCLDDPTDVCLEALSTAVYGKSGYGAPVLGTVKTVKSFTKEMIVDYMQQHYIPQNIVVSIAGNTTEEQAMALTKKYFEDKFNIANLKAEKAFKQKEVAPKMLTKIKNLAQMQIAFSFPAFDMHSDKTDAMITIAGVLGGGMSSRLFQQLREEMGLAYDVHTIPRQYSQSGGMMLYIATSPATAKTAVAEMGKVVRQMVKEGITEKELTKTKAQSKTSVVLGAESSIGIMRKNGSKVLHKNELSNTAKTIAQIEAVTAEEVKQVLGEIFDFSKVSGSFVGKKIDFDPIAVFKGE